MVLHHPPPNPPPEGEGAFGRWGLGGEFQDAEQVLEAVVAHEWIALHVEEEVVWGRRGERLEAEVLAERRQDLKRQRIAMPLLHLEPSLLAKPGERHFVDSLDRLVGGAGTEFGDRCDAREIQPAGLIATHAGDEAQMVVLPPAQLAGVDPAADAAVVNRIWIGAPTLPSPRGGGKYNPLELALDAPVVGAVVLQTQVLLTAIAQDQMYLFRLAPLDGRDLFGVDAALEDSRRLCLAGQLGVGNLVAVGAELAGAVDPHQEVGMAPPAAIEESALVDDVDALTHGGQGLVVRFGKSSDGSVREREFHHSAMAGSKRGQMASFMLEATPGQNLEFRVLPLWAIDLTASGGQLLLGEVFALQKARQIG